MRRSRAVLLCVGSLVAFVGSSVPARAQSPLGYVTARGSTVTPAYEGWYRNADGTLTLSFGFYNRNSAETLDVPRGPDNHIEPARFDGPQPTHFTPSRQWGAFGIVIPADYDGPPVAWTLRNRGKTFTIPANTKAEWEIDAVKGEADGNKPPVLALSENGPWVAGPAGQYGEAQARVGTPATLRVWAKDDGVASVTLGGGRDGEPVTLTWFKHSGPGEVMFDVESEEIPYEGGSMTTHATFSQAGEYVVRVRANDASGVNGAGHSQCCWTNAFVRVSVGNQP
jgi:hypothetical protein